MLPLQHESVQFRCTPHSACVPRHAADQRAEAAARPPRSSVSIPPQQCLGALAESAVANGDTASASEIAQIFVEAINQPEDGWMFEARQGCAARECAGQGLIKLASTGAAQMSGTLVNPAGNTGQTAAVFVPAFVEEAKRRVHAAGADATAVSHE